MNDKRIRSDTSEVTLLECTLRDGSYAIDFKFNDADTRLLVALLDGLGFKWIEVGHGLGLGASGAGKGKMPCSDDVLIKAAKSAGKDAMIGMFCIPDIASLDMISFARDCGLDFIRVGQNAPYAETAFPYLQQARSVGLIPAMNFMKSYAISPDEFGEKAKAAYEAGAEIIYLVDSVGGMFTDDVSRYLDAVRKRCGCKLGFHGHDNLKMSVANSIRAYECGATFIDVTLYGLGRGSGNAPTEVMVAVFERLGIRTGIDLFNVLDVAETYIWPLMSHIQMHDMLAVAMGYGQFHSSFLPQVAKVAKQYRVDLKRLVATLGTIDPVTVRDDVLKETATALANTESSQHSQALISFVVPDISTHKINTTLSAVKSLLDGMVVTAAKRKGAKAILELKPADEKTDNLVLPDFIMEDNNIVLGRVIFGSYEMLREIMVLAHEKVFMFLVDICSCRWAKETLAIASSLAGKDRVIPLRSDRLQCGFLLDTIELAAHKYGSDSILLYGSNTAVLAAMDHRCIFEHVFVYDPVNEKQLSDSNITVLRSINDWRALNLKFDIILCESLPSEQDAKALLSSLSSDGKILITSIPQSLSLKNKAGEQLIFLDRRNAYSGLFTRLIATSSNISVKHPIEA